ncbi:MAG: carbamoyltransferase HypF [Bilifractor sp.]|jgi:hydrogenase maturation protein HypF
MTDSGNVVRQIKIYGIVQGVGFRPTVARHAACCGIRGTVCNRGSFVEIVAEGSLPAVEAFVRRIREQPPRRAVILKMDVRPMKTAEHYAGFEIIESRKTKGEIFVSPDIAICDECRAELLNPSDRRYLHPFINCTSCGPRLTILESLPYDRERTSMKVFPMCPECRHEYITPSTRRYDAQPVCCSRCGPEVYLLPKDGSRPRITGRKAILETRRVLAGGGIAAVKGIGGFHLCCDASDTDAVRRLRRLKHRPAKPFAVMMRDEAAVQAECVLTQEQRAILTGHQKPILLLEKKSAGRLSPAVAPDNPKVGVMLPYAPVQILLFQYDDALSMTPMLVMTSGNVSGAPICRDDREALEELSSFADVILSNNRNINIRCDDSVMDFYRDRPYMIRRSRGYAPLPYLISEGPVPGRTVLAVGGELKNTFCIGKGDLFYPSSYIGDLADVRSTQALRETIRRFETLLEAKPDLVVCDLHPGYRSTEIAGELASGIPLVRVQHHYAHILSCMAENDRTAPVLGISFDGTGYGIDGTIWGGEILLADTHSFRRLGSAEPFLHIGGDTASREGWRIAASMICGLFGEKNGKNYNSVYREEDGAHSPEEIMTALDLCSPAEAGIIRRMHEKRLNAVESTSCGRIFDAVSAILGIRRSSTFEGEASTALMYRALRYRKSIGGEEQSDTAAASGPFTRNCGNSCDTEDLYHIPEAETEKSEIRKAEASGSGLFWIPTGAIVRRIIIGKLAGEDPDRLAWLFHKLLSEETCRLLVRLRETDSRLPDTAALSGGCFQNTLLLELTQNLLEENGFHVLTHHLVSPNDGGIALGQAYYGACLPPAHTEK